MICRATPASPRLIGLVSSYHLLRRRFLNLRVFDQELSDPNQFIRFSAAKCKGLYRCAATILDVTKEEMRSLVSERKHPVGDIVYRCFFLAFSCKCLSFARTRLNLGRHGYEVDVSAIIAATDPGKCDGPLHWCVRKGHWLAAEHYQKYVRARDAQHNLDEEFRHRINRLAIVDRST